MAHTHGPCSEPDVEDFAPVAIQLVDLAHTGNLPSFLEIMAPASVFQVQEELRHWGYHGVGLDAWPQPAFLCPAIEADQCNKVHYLLCRQEVGVELEIFVHSANELWTDQHILRFLCAIGYSRAGAYLFHMAKNNCQPSGSNTTG